MIWYFLGVVSCFVNQPHMTYQQKEEPWEHENSLKLFNMETESHATTVGLLRLPQALHFSLDTSTDSSVGALSLEIGVTHQVQVPLVYLPGNGNYSMTCYYGNKI